MSEEDKTKLRFWGIVGGLSLAFGITVASMISLSVQLKKSETAYRNTHVESVGDSSAIKAPGNGHLVCALAGLGIAAACMKSH